MSFLLPIELAATEVRPGIGRTPEGARANGTLFLSLFTLTKMLALAREGVFRDVQHLSEALDECYFAGRTDRLRPPDNSEACWLRRPTVGRRKYAVPSDWSANKKLSLRKIPDSGHLVSFRRNGDPQ
jgi:hypothetical protein